MHFLALLSWVINQETVFLQSFLYIEGKSPCCMPKISVRGYEMPASPIRKLAPLANAAKQRGIHVYHLNIGQPDLPTPPAAINAIRNIDRKILEYSPSR